MIRFEYIFRLMFSLHLFNYYRLLLYSLIDPPDVTNTEGYMEWALEGGLAVVSRTMLDREGGSITALA